MLADFLIEILEFAYKENTILMDFLLRSTHLTALRCAISLSPM